MSTLSVVLPPEESVSVTLMVAVSIPVPRVLGATGPGPCGMVRRMATYSLVAFRNVAVHEYKPSLELIGVPTLVILLRSVVAPAGSRTSTRSEEHTSELQSHSDLVCRLLLE